MIPWAFMDADERWELFAHFLILFALIIGSVDKDDDEVNVFDWLYSHF